MSNRIGIIGAGIGGLSAAIRLAALGYQVSVFEKNTLPGGKLSEIHQDGFRFDTGPSVFTMPELVDELFYLVGKEPGDYFQYTKLNQSCKYFFEDGTVINAQQNIQEFANELESKTGEEPQNLYDFLNKSRTIYDLTSDVFVFQSIHDKKNLFRKSSLKALFNFHKIDAFRTMHQANASFFSTAKTVRLFDRYATYNGSDPYKAPATLNIIPHLEHSKGTYFPEKGIFSIIDNLVSLAKELGVDFYFNQEVKYVDWQNNKVTSIITDDGIWNIDKVVSDMDVQTFYSRVMKDEELFAKNKQYEKSSSAIIFYWGMNGQFPPLNLHNIFFAENYKQEFQSIFEKKEIYNDPTIYVYISSKHVPSDAPKGKENWYVMINAPENVGQDWKRFKEQARQYIVSKLNHLLKTNIENFIEFEHYMDPRDIEAHTSSFHGSLYGNSSNDKFAAFNRHPNFSKRIKNLYFVGGSVHPGGGIPLCLASAKIVADKIQQRDDF